MCRLSVEIWLLSANLLIAKGAVFHIYPTDTKWLKINSRIIGSLAKSALILQHEVEARSGNI
jgi:hypothetical protein